MSESSRAQLDLQAVLDAAVDAVILIDEAGNIETFNRSAERLFGWEAAEVAGRNVALLMPAPYRAEHDGYMHNYMTTGRARIIGIGREVEAQRRDGTVFPASLAVGEIPHSIPRRFVGFLHDITARKAATEALRRERDRAQAYLDLAEVMLLAVDVRGTITLVNRKGCELLGWKESELLGRDWFETCTPPESRAALRQAFERLVRDGIEAVSGSESTILTRDGSRRLVGWRNSVLRDHEGRPTGTLSSGEDITERRAAEVALRKSESLLRAAQAIAKLGNFEVQLDEAGPAHWSAEVFRLLGQDADSPPPTFDEFMEQVVHPDDRARFAREWRRAVAEVGQFELECRLLRQDGEARDVEVRVQVGRGPRGRVAAGTLHDITDRKRTEEDVRQGEARLAHFARLSTMGEMAAGLAHEVNQPLTAIATYAQAATRMMARPEGADRADLDEALGQITAQALRAGEVIRRLRAFVKNRETRQEAVDCNRLVEELRLLVEPDARINDMRLRLELAPSVPPVGADPVQIQQVLINLVRNAIEVTLETPGALREVRILTQATAEGGVEVAVEDHGHGLAPGAADNLFNPFFTTKPTGTGLGLAISRSIIRAHAGRLAHRPTPGGGCTFYFTLPPLGTEPGAATP